MLGRAREAALKSAHETGVMPVAHGMRYLLDGHVTYLQELGGFEQPFFSDYAAELETRLLLKQPL